MFAAAFLAARWAGSPAVDRYGGTPVSVCVLCVEAVGFVLLAALPTLVGALAGAALAGVGVRLMFPATVALTLHRSPNAGPGTTVGATTSFWDLGILVASPLSGLIAAHAGYPAAFALAAAAAVAAGGLAIALGHTARWGRQYRAPSSAPSGPDQADSMNRSSKVTPEPFPTGVSPSPAPVAQRIERGSSKSTAAGSNPAGRAG